MAKPLNYLLPLKWWGRGAAKDIAMTYLYDRPAVKEAQQNDAQELMGLLRSLIRKAAIQGYTRPWLENALKATLQTYPHLFGTMQEVAILLFISRSVSRHCPYTIDTDELRRLWGK